MMEKHLGSSALDTIPAINPPRTLELAWSQCEQAAKDLAAKLDIGLMKPDRLKLYGVPRGGTYAALLLYGALERRGIPTEIVGRPESATHIVDDLIDSGNTQLRYVTEYQRPFVALFERDLFPGNPWLVFPWEHGQDPMKDTSADDIPLRLLQYIGEDPKRGGLIETPKRFLKAFKDYTSGYAVDAHALLKTFEDGAKDYDEMVIVKDIPVYSLCEHHLAPFFGVAHVGYLPDRRIVGLSKLARVVDAYARRLQVQERLTHQIARCIQEALQPRAVGVILECRHMCMEARGVQRQGTSTVTSAMLGGLREDPSMRSEFLKLVK